MKEGSMITAAEKVLKEAGKEMKFSELWEKVKAELEITPEEEASRIGHFYTDLSMAGSVFVVLGNNVWDLRVRQPYSKVHIDVSSAYIDLEESTGGDAEDAKENAEYDESVQGGLSDGGISDTGATDGEGLEDTDKGISTNDYIGGSSRLGDDY